VRDRFSERDAEHSGRKEIELYRAMRAEKVGKAALAKRLGVALPQVDRMLDLRHRSRLDAIERALAALGRSLTIVVKAAA
jgi:antitoxin HicB